MNNLKRFLIDTRTKNKDVAAWTDRTPQLIAWWAAKDADIEHKVMRDIYKAYIKIVKKELKLVEVMLNKQEKKK